MDAFPEQSSLRSLIDAAEANILRIESQISDLTSVLQKERSTLARLWLMATPMGKLPTELLVEIFTQFVEEDDSCDSDSMQIDNADLVIGEGPCSPTRQILVLSQVCPYWRRLVNSTPKLWTAGIINVQLDKNICGTEAYLNGLKTLLERSEPLPISVSLAQEGRSGTSAEAIVQAATTSAVIRAMAPTVRRWKSLKVDCLSFKPLSALPGGSFPALESLDIQYETYDQIDPVRAFFPAPQLRRLSLRLYGAGELLPLPWSQLTHLKLDHKSLAVCREILMQCSNLVSANLLTIEWNFQNTVAAPATALPALEVLKVQFDMGTDDLGRVEPFFEPLFLPVLHTLNLTFDPSPEVLWPAREISAFQTRSPHITHIALAHCPLTSAQLAFLLRDSPEITTLELTVCRNCVDDEFLRRLTYNANDADAPLAPRLQKIILETVGYEYSDNAFEAAIRSRWWTDAQEGTSGVLRQVARLQMVSISPYVADTTEPGLVERTQDVLGQGLQLNFGRNHG